MSNTSQATSVLKPVLQRVPSLRSKLIVAADPNGAGMLPLWRRDATTALHMGNKTESKLPYIGHLDMSPIMDIMSKGSTERRNKEGISSSTPTSQNQPRKAPVVTPLPTAPSFRRQASIKEGPTSIEGTSAPMAAASAPRHHRKTSD